MVRTPKGARLRRAEKRERARVNWTGVRRKEKPKKSIACRAVGDLRFSEVNFVLSVIPADQTRSNLPTLVSPSQVACETKNVAVRTAWRGMVYSFTPAKEKRLSSSALSRAQKARQRLVFPRPVG